MPVLKIHCNWCRRRADWLNAWYALNDNAISYIVKLQLIAHWNKILKSKSMKTEHAQGTYHLLRMRMVLHWRLCNFVSSVLFVDCPKSPISLNRTPIHRHFPAIFHNLLFDIVQRNEIKVFEIIKYGIRMYWVAMHVYVYDLEIAQHLRSDAVFAFEYSIEIFFVWYANEFQQKKMRWERGMINRKVVAWNEKKGCPFGKCTHFQMPMHTHTHNAQFSIHCPIEIGRIHPLHSCSWIVIFCVYRITQFK